MSTILAFDTSGPSLSVALVQGEKMIYERTQQNGLTHSDTLMPMAEEAMETGRIAIGDVDLIAVVTGPGSFTGVRIGVTTAKGLAAATGKPVIGITALEAMAAGVLPYVGVVCPMQDARAGQVYCAAFQSGTQILPDAAEKLADFLERVKPLGPCCFVGDGAAAHREAIREAMGENALFAPVGSMAVRASAVAMLAAGRVGEAISHEKLLPYYLRAPQAERERLAKEAAQHG